MRPWEIHPKLVVFPIAFLLGGVVLDLYSAARHRAAGRRAATSMLLVGLWTGLFAAAAGVLAYLTVPAHTDRAHEQMHWHIAAMASALVLFLFVVLARRRAREGIPGAVTTVTGIVAAALLTTGAHLGGLMVLRGGAGVDPAVLAPELRGGHQHGSGTAGADHGTQPKHEHGQSPDAAKQPPTDAPAKHAHGATAPSGNAPTQPPAGAHERGAEGHTAPPAGAKPEQHDHGDPRAAEPKSGDRQASARTTGEPVQQQPGGHEHGAEQRAPPPASSKGDEHAHGARPAGEATDGSATKPGHEGHEAVPAQDPKPAQPEHRHDPQAAPMPPASEPKAVKIPPKGLPPGEPGRDYMPVVTPNGETLAWKVVDGVKVFHLVAEEVEHEFAPGLTARCWGYNGRIHGPTIEAVEGDRVRIYVTNRLPAATSVHWHGILLPNGMDGVAGLNQAVIPTGETFRYEFVLRQHGTHMYHSHHDEMVQMGMGLMGMFVIHPRTPPAEPPQRDFAIMLSEWRIDPGTSRPNPMEMSDFNVLTFNGRASPGTAPLVAATGERVRIRIGNLSAMDNHPIHLHGYQFRVTETDGGQIPPSAQQLETTVLVQVGSTRTIDFVADAPGDWALHCHMTHHVMNQMGHMFPNMIGVDTKDLDTRVQQFLPGYMTMGANGMADMHAGMTIPANSIAMRGTPGPFGEISMGGMFTVLKVRDRIEGQQDPGWYAHPEGTVASPARPEDLERDGIKVPDGRVSPPRAGGHEQHR